MRVVIIAFAFILLLLAGCASLKDLDRYSYSYTKTIYKCFDGRLVQNVSECAILKDACPEFCDDNDLCTYDSCSEFTNFTCTHSKNPICCGDTVCSYDESENCATCQEDCGCTGGKICSPSNIQSDFLGCMVPSAPAQSGFEKRSYSWNYSGRKWLFEVELSNKTDAFYKSRAHEGRPYDLYVSDSFGAPFISDVAKYFRGVANKTEMSQDETAYLVVSFVQSLPYTSDEVTANADEYPRFPYETLFDDGGDCEDTSILAASLLRELGYDTVLIQLKDHMAVGVRCSLSGRDKVPYNGVQYCYLETTGEGWDIGTIPEEYKKESLEVIQVSPRPFFGMNSSAIYTYDGIETFININATLKNLGSIPAERARITGLLEDSDGRTWDETTYNASRKISPEEEVLVKLNSLKIPGMRKFRIRLQVRADNMEMQERAYDWFIWDKD